MTLKKIIEKYKQEILKILLSEKYYNMLQEITRFYITTNQASNDINVLQILIETTHETYDIE